MLVGDLIYNDDFDCNCNIEVYDCTENGIQYHNGAKVIHATCCDKTKPLDRILDMKIKYITTSENGTLIIEATR